MRAFTDGHLGHALPPVHVCCRDRAEAQAESAAAQAAVLREPVVDAKVAKASISEEEARMRKAVIQQYDQDSGSDEDGATGEGADDGATARSAKQLSKKAQKKMRKATTAQDMAMNFVNTNKTAQQDQQRAVKEMNK